MLFVCYTPKFPENPKPNRTNQDLGRCCSVASQSIGCLSRFGLRGQQGARSQSQSQSQPRSKKPDRYWFEPQNRYRAPSSLGSFAGMPAVRKTRCKKRCTFFLNIWMISEFDRLQDALSGGFLQITIPIWCIDAIKHWKSIWTTLWKCLVFKVKHLGFAWRI